MKIVKRPWGDFTQFVKNKKCTVKILEVKPKQELSLQYHRNRKEMWYFLTDGYVQLGLDKKRVKKGELVIIKKRMAHRVFSKDKKITFLEVSLGKFSEGDEIRIEDKYGRAK
jgi:mannose-6-phosphate isomerase-like protein (cupin superfamily)